MDDVSDNAIMGNIELPKGKLKKKAETTNYNMSVEDKIPDYEWEGLFDKPMRVFNLSKKSN